MKVGVIIILLLECFSAHGQAVFKGGQQAFEKFLKKNVVYPEYSLNHCLEGTVWVSFKLDLQGKVYQERIDKGLGLDLDDEALRIIRLSSGSWEAGRSSERYILPVSFNLNRPECKNRTSQDILNAIRYYHIQVNLENTVFNYYKNQPEGSNDEIECLKQQLGFDEDYVARQMERARQMIAQGDKSVACEVLNRIKNIGSHEADDLSAQYCK